MKLVDLTDPELRICAWVGKMRWSHARNKGLDPGDGPTATALDAVNDIRGAECEYSGSIMLNLYWRPTIGDTTSKDVGGIIEVRSTDLENGRLIVKPDGNGPYVLVKKKSRTRFEWGGWIMADAAKRWPLLTQFGDPAHFVPQDALLSMDDLHQWISRHEG